MRTEDALVAILACHFDKRSRRYTRLAANKLDAVRGKQRFHTIANAADHFLRTVAYRTEVNRRLRNAHAEQCGFLCLRKDFRAVKHRLRRNAASIQARPAHLCTLHKRAGNA